ncbi:MAG: hypothetical protein GF346_00165, partial [Candidatus Eisenbacteria bacterium]|nr:hypothetical protein [Candidatus Latescibacterota bacterium]MBD3300846.1 hypothetical protein [Candidatus Eisenbacteria bacterium]
MRLRWIASIALLLAAGCLLIPDDQEEGTRVSNLRPKVQITAGAATSDSAGIDYKVRFQWLGSDEDGVVRRFEYAVDDTTTEGAWRDTTGYNVDLRMRASHRRDPGDESDAVFTDWHTFYIRAVDNEYAVSRSDHRYFNARTIAPSAKITFPSITSGAPSLVKTFSIEWEGEDMDSSQPEREPAFYEYKLIQLRTQFFDDEEIVDSLYAKPNVLLDSLRAGDRTAWVRVDGSVRERTLRDLQDTGSAVLVFALRAIDEAGATEPFLERGDNFIVFHVQDKDSQPNVRISEPTLGSHQFPSDGAVWQVEVPTNTPIRFRWTGDASYYGSRVGNVNYGLDVPDPADPRFLDPQGIGGWIGWSDREKLAVPFIFPDSENGQTHIFYLQMKDESDEDDSIRLCTVIMTIVAFTFERTALLVDDAPITYGLNPRDQDEIHDAFIERFVGRMRDYAPQGLDRRSLYKPRSGYPESLNPTDNERIPLAEMARYEALLWSFNFTRGVTTGLWLHERP